MRKFISFIAAFIAVVTTVNAQTVESSRLFENTYFGVNGGVISPFNSNNGWGNSLRPVVGVEFGKDITPVVGFSVEGVGAINTTGAKTWFDQSNVIGNVKFNVSNLFGGYKGYPRRVEFLVVPGMGWGHNYGYKAYTTSDNNYLTYNAYGQVNFNLGQSRAWQINVKPGVTWATGNPDVAFDSRRAAATVRVGFTYKFGSKSKHSHNFVNCPYSVTKADYDAVVAERDALKNRAPETVQVVKEVPVEKVVTKEVTNTSNTLTIPFSIGRYELTKAEKALVSGYAKSINSDANVTVTGSADLGTGTKEINNEIATNRAENVAKVLRENGVKNVTTKTSFDTNEVPEASRTAVVIAY